MSKIAEFVLKKIVGLHLNDPVAPPAETASKLLQVITQETLIEAQEAMKNRCIAYFMKWRDHQESGIRPDEAVDLCVDGILRDVQPEELM